MRRVMRVLLAVALRDALYFLDGADLRRVECATL